MYSYRNLGKIGLHYAINLIVQVQNHSNKQNALTGQMSGLWSDELREKVRFNICLSFNQEQTNKSKQEALMLTINRPTFTLLSSYLLYKHLSSLLPLARWLAGASLTGYLRGCLKVFTTNAR